MKIQSNANSARAALLLALSVSPALQAQGVTADGAALYLEYCAVCHGQDARGDGPMAAGLTRPPANLRQLTQASDGKFPDERVRTAIDGRDLPLQHGTRDMPVWGQAFKRSRGAQGEQRVAAHMDALVDYLRSIQTP